MLARLSSMNRDPLTVDSSPDVRDPRWRVVALSTGAGDKWASVLAPGMMGGRADQGEGWGSSGVSTRQLSRTHLGHMRTTDDEKCPQPMRAETPGGTPFPGIAAGHSATPEDVRNVEVGGSSPLTSTGLSNALPGAPSVVTRK